MGSRVEKEWVVNQGCCACLKLMQPVDSVPNRSTSRLAAHDPLSWPPAPPLRPFITYPPTFKPHQPSCHTPPHTPSTSLATHAPTPQPLLQAPHPCCRIGRSCRHPPWSSCPAFTPSAMSLGLASTQHSPVWPSGSPMVYLHSPRVFHSLMVLSREPDTICRTAHAGCTAGSAHSRSNTAATVRRMPCNKKNLAWSHCCFR